MKKTINHTGGTTMISGTVKHSSNVVEQSKLYMVRTMPCGELIAPSLLCHV